jgi:hypothetical protein
MATNAEKALKVQQLAAYFAQMGQGYNYFNPVARTQSDALLGNAQSEIMRLNQEVEKQKLKEKQKKNQLIGGGIGLAFGGVPGMFLGARSAKNADNDLEAVGAGFFGGLEQKMAANGGSNAGGAGSGGGDNSGGLGGVASGAAGGFMAGGPIGAIIGGASGLFGMGTSAAGAMGQAGMFNPIGDSFTSSSKHTESGPGLIEKKPVGPLAEGYNFGGPAQGAQAAPAKDPNTFSVDNAFWKQGM